MKKYLYPSDKRSSLIVIVVIYAIYLVVFAIYHPYLGIGGPALAIVPVIGASWYFGVAGGILTALCWQT